MATPPPRKKVDSIRDLDGDGIIDGGDDPSLDLDRDGRIDAGDREIYDLDNDNDIDAKDRQLQAEQGSPAEEQEQTLSVRAALELEKKTHQSQSDLSNSVSQTGFRQK
ncbi:hypothetical protein SAMN02745166_04195 [Prosthecobacter debontii]|uniref:Uncharacterized protein n=1 Tax=Prosthecobacter debontii TaxID=48467 RepID=A0A1T4YUA6_9BACT|nr:hypothetical protein [Prosthecobacter debontii]SKB05178.1 hypothetical protein SAMN02745166_04195 [Prosthecobacter debontii]